MDHRLPISECAARKARPTGRAGDEADVEEEEEGKKVIGYGNGNGSAYKTPFKSLVSISFLGFMMSQEIRSKAYPDKQPVHECIQRCAD